MLFQNIERHINAKLKRIVGRQQLPIQINHFNDSIFIHIPKNAGSSIASALELFATSHVTVKEIQTSIGTKKFKEYFSFAVVRNPWDRFLSLYNYARMEESLYHSAINPEVALYGKHLDYDLLKGGSLEECAEFLVEGKLKHDETWNQWLPQVFWLVDDKDKIAVDFYGRFEHLASDFDFILSKLGMEKKRLPSINKGQRKDFDYRAYYTKRAKEIVGNYYQEDIERFGYTF